MSGLQAERRAPGRGWGSVAAYHYSELVLEAGVFAMWGLHTTGRHHVPRTGAFVLAPTHQSVLDPVTCGIAARDRPLTYIARDTLFTFKPFGALIRLYGAVPIERGASDSAAIRLALGELAAGRALLIFPEGTRCHDGRTAPFQPGMVLLARRSKVPLVPMAMDGSFDLWPRGSDWPRLHGAIEQEVGPPIPPEEIAERVKGGSEQFLADLRREAECMRLRCRARLRERTNGAWPPPGPADTPYWDA